MLGFLLDPGITAGCWDFLLDLRMTAECWDSYWVLGSPLDPRISPDPAMGARILSGY